MLVIYYLFNYLYLFIYLFIYLLLCVCFVFLCVKQGMNDLIITKYGKNTNKIFGFHIWGFFFFFLFFPPLASHTYNVWIT